MSSLTSLYQYCIGGGDGNTKCFKLPSKTVHKNAHDLKRTLTKNTKDCDKYSSCFKNPIKLGVIKILEYVEIDKSDGKEKPLWFNDPQFIKDHGVSTKYLLNLTSILLTLQEGTQASCALFPIEIARCYQLVDKSDFNVNCNKIDNKCILKIKNNTNGLTQPALNVMTIHNPNFEYGQEIICDKRCGTNNDLSRPYIKCLMLKNEDVFQKHQPGRIFSNKNIKLGKWTPCTENDFTVEQYEKFSGCYTYVTLWEEFMQWVDLGYEQKDPNSGSHIDPTKLPSVTRIKDLLGLLHGWPSGYFIEVYIKSSDLIRPCVNPDTTQNHCQFFNLKDQQEKNAKIKNSVTSLTYNEKYDNYFATSFAKSIEELGIPFSGMGYTMDIRTGRKGIGEFIMKPNAVYYVNNYAPHKEYLIKALKQYRKQHEELDRIHHNCVTDYKINVDKDYGIVQVKKCTVQVKKSLGLQPAELDKMTR